MAERQRR